jgi:macrolide-specific efflux system membrane fusion protein
MITLDAYPDQPIPAVVHHIAYDARNVNNVTAYDVEAMPISIPNFMRNGMTANVVFEISTKKNVLILPFSAIGQTDGHTTVTVQDPDDLKLKSIPIEVGANDGKEIEVVSGLQEGQTVLEPVLQFPDKKRAGELSLSLGGGSRRK